MNRRRFLQLPAIAAAAAAVLKPEPERVSIATVDVQRDGLSVYRFDEESPGRTGSRWRVRRTWIAAKDFPQAMTILAAFAGLRDVAAYVRHTGDSLLARLLTPQNSDLHDVAVVERAGRLATPRMIESLVGRKVVQTSPFGSSLHAVDENDRVLFNLDWPDSWPQVITTRIAMQDGFEVIDV